MRKAASLAALAALAVAVAPAAGATNIVGGVVYAVTMPFVALTTTYVYFDARVRSELEGEHHPVELPAEIGFSG